MNENTEAFSTVSNSRDILDIVQNQDHTVNMSIKYVSVNKE